MAKRKLKEEELKVANPQRWLAIAGKQIEGLIVEFNNIAFELDEDVIMAFRAFMEKHIEGSVQYRTTSAGNGKIAHSALILYVEIPKPTTNAAPTGVPSNG
jgi:hypothetical protein